MLKELNINPKRIRLEWFSTGESSKLSSAIDDFLKTVDFIKKINFSFINLFGYSPRKETTAYKLKNRVCERIRDERVKKVKKIVDEMNCNYRKKFINKKLEVVIESKKNGYYTGKSENYINFFINSDNKKLDIRKRYNVLFTKIENNLNYAKLCI